MLVVSVDQSSHETTAAAFDLNRGRLVATATERTPGRDATSATGVVLDPDTLWTSFCNVLRGLMTKIDSLSPKPGPVRAIGLTNQRETCVVWDADSGEPLAPAVLWQDDRCYPEVELFLRDRKRVRDFHRRTGLEPSAWFTCFKLAYLIKNNPAVALAAADGRLRFGTIDSWIVYKLTGRTQIEITNASRTGLMDIETGTWSEDIREYFGLQESAYPEIVSSAEVYGTVGNTGTSLDDAGIVISGIAGNKGAAMFAHTHGAGIWHQNSVSCIMSTGAYLFAPLGDKPVLSRTGLLTTVMPQVSREAPLEYVFEGSVQVAGQLFRWLRDNLRIINHYSDIGPLYSSVPDSGGVVVVPAMTGLGAPHWMPSARGGIYGITQFTTKAHLVHAAVDSIALAVDELLAAMYTDQGRAAGRARPPVIVEGPLAREECLLRCLATTAQTEIRKPGGVSAALLGGAALAVIGAGLAPAERLASVLPLIPTDISVFSPDLSVEAQDNISRVKRAYHAGIERSAWEGV